MTNEPRRINISLSYNQTVTQLRADPSPLGRSAYGWLMKAEKDFRSLELDKQERFTKGMEKEVAEKFFKAGISPLPLRTDADGKVVSIGHLHQQIEILKGLVSECSRLGLGREKFDLLAGDYLKADELNKLTEGKNGVPLAIK